MKIRPVEAELFDVGGGTDRQTCQSWQSSFTVLR